MTNLYKMLRKIKSYIPSGYNKRIKNASFLSIGHILSIIIGLIGMPIIARKLGAENYGIYATVGSFVGLFGFINLGGTAKVLVREGSKDINKLKNDIESLIGIKNLLAFLSIIITICVSLFIEKYSLIVKFNILIFSFNHFIKANKSLLSSIYQAIEKMEYLAYFVVAKRLLYISVAVFAVLIGGGVTVIIIINILSNLTILLVNYKISKSFLEFKLINPVVFNKRLIKPSIIFSVLGILAYFQTRIDFVMLSWLGNTKEVGLYAVAYKISRYSASFRSHISTAFFPMFVKRVNEGRIKLKKLFKFFFILLVIAGAVAGIISYFSVDIINLLFGKEYAFAGKILSVLILYISLAYASIPISLVLNALYKEKIQLIFSSISAVSNIILNIIFYRIYGLIGIAYSTLLTKLISIIISLFYTALQLKNHSSVY